GLLRPRLVRRQQFNAAQYKLDFEKWIGLSIRTAPLCIINVEPEIEPAQQFQEPLMDERFGYKNQCTFHASGQDQAVQNQAGFDSLPQPDFIRQQNAWGDPACNFRCYVNLMRN